MWIDINKSKSLGKFVLIFVSELHVAKTALKTNQSRNRAYCPFSEKQLLLESSETLWKSSQFTWQFNLDAEHHSLRASCLKKQKKEEKQEET